MFHQLKLTLYAIILTLAVVFIMPFANEAADTPPASPIEKNNTGSWKTGTSKDGNWMGDGRKTTSKKVKARDHFPMSEWTGPEESPDPAPPENSNTAFPNHEWTPGKNKTYPNNEKGKKAGLTRGNRAPRILSQGKIQNHPTLGKVWVPLRVNNDDGQGCDVTGCPPGFSCPDGTFCMIDQPDDDEDSLKGRLTPNDNARMTPNLGSQSGGKAFRRPIPIPPALQPK